MEIIKYHHYRGNVEEISYRYRAFSKLKDLRIKKSSDLRWIDDESGYISHHLQVSFFGKTGYGKSTTINSFFGNSVMQTSNVTACTRECRSLDFRLSADSYLSLADFPGIGESEYRDMEYLKMYSDFLSSSSVIVYVIRADTRDYSIDQEAYKKIFTTDLDRNKIIFAMNFCDKIEPTNRHFTQPSHQQLINIKNKVDEVKKIFNPVNNIVPYSAETSWNMIELSESIVNAILVSNNILT